MERIARRERGRSPREAARPKKRYFYTQENEKTECKKQNKNDY
jgi:hypothetical protein